MPKISLINFGDSPIVLTDVRRKLREVKTGTLVTLDLPQFTINRIQNKMPSVAAFPEDIAVDTDSPQLLLALDTLRNFSSTPYNDILAAVNRIMGDGAMGLRPNHEEMRMELARRTANAAYHIQNGAIEDANAVLTAPLPKPVGKPEDVATRTDVGLVVRGDDVEDDEENRISGDDDGDATRRSERNHGEDSDEEDDEEGDATAGEETGGQEVGAGGQEGGSGGQEGSDLPTDGQGGSRSAEVSQGPGRGKGRPGKLRSQPNGRPGGRPSNRVGGGG